MIKLTLKRVRPACYPDWSRELGSLQSNRNAEMRYLVIFQHRRLTVAAMIRRAQVSSMVVLWREHRRVYLSPEIPVP